MRKIGLISFLTIVLVAFGILVFASGKKDKEAKIKRIIVNNTNYINDNEIIDLVKNDVIGTMKDSINIIQIYAKVNQYQYVESSNLYFDDDALVMEIKERQPIAYYILNNQTKYLTNDFKIVDFRKINSSYDLPVLRLIGNKSIKELKNLNSLFELLNGDDIKFLKAHISEINYNTINGEVEFILTENAIEVKLGYSQDWKKNLKKFENYWLTISFKERNQINNIDLRWDKRIIIS